MTAEITGYTPEETEGRKTKILSLRDAEARKEAATLAKSGEVIGSYNRGVCAMWGDGANSNFPGLVAKIKGEQRGLRPLAASLPTAQFIDYLDTTHFPSSLRSIFADADRLAATTGSLCFFRGPITEKAAQELPQSMVSRVDGVPIIQNWDARGHSPTHKLVSAMNEAGIKYPAVTSMNTSGEPEITDQKEGIAFSKSKGIPIFLEDQKDPKRAVGSYTILGISHEGLKLVREGNIPSQLIQELLGKEIDTSNATVAKSMQPLDFSADKIEGVNPRIARIAILSSVNNYHPAITGALLRGGKLLK